MCFLRSTKHEFVIKTEDIVKTKELIDAFGFIYYDAPGEADQLCAYFVKKEIAWACLSDDMDMFLYGCTRVLRNLSLMKHEVCLYRTTDILCDLGLSLNEFRDIVVLSGTDYEISGTPINISIRKAFEYYKKYKESTVLTDFYTWLNESCIIENNDLYKISEMMNINTYVCMLENFMKSHIQEKPKFSVSAIKNIMKQYKFIFV